MSMFSKKKKKSDDDDDEEEDSGNTVTNLLKSKLPFLASVMNKSKKDAEDEEELDEDDEDQPKKKFELKRVHVIGIIVILVIVLLDFDEEPAPEPVKKPIKKAKNIKEDTEKKDSVKVIDEKKPEDTAREIPNTIAEDSVENKVVEIPDQTTEESLDDEFEKMAKEASAEVEKESERKREEELLKAMEPPVTEPIVEKEPRIDMNDSSKVPEDTRGEFQNSPVEDNISMDQTDNSMENDNLNNDIGEVIVPEESFKPDVSTEITKKLLKDLEGKLKEEKKEQSLVEVTKPVSSPLYDSVGYGLVYNCKDKHWACIEMNAYNQCRQNYSWNIQNNIPVECYPFAVLESEFDCATVQQEKIDTIGDTDFCN